MADGTKRDWRELCVAVTNENDSTKIEFTDSRID